MSKPKRTKSYLTKEVLNRAVNKGVKQASAKAMDTAGSVVVARGNWVVRSHKDGTVEKIKPIPKVPQAKIDKKLNKLGGR